jgi:hypothetical protein
VYVGLVILVQILETKLLAPTIAMAVYLASSGTYIVCITMMHRVGHEPEVISRSGFRFIGVCVAFIVLGLALALVIGVNAKFLLGGTL